MGYRPPERQLALVQRNLVWDEVRIARLQLRRRVRYWSGSMVAYWPR
jgi:hypothetical protein